MLKHLPLRPAFNLLLILAAIACPTYDIISQTDTGESELELAEARVRSWEGRVRELVEISESSTEKLPGAERAFYLVLLARIEWKSDNELARQHLTKAAPLVFSELQKTDVADMRRQLFFAKKAVTEMLDLDFNFANSLLRSLNASLDSTTGSVKQEPEFADFFAFIATKVASSNPQLAHSLAIRSLRYGIASDLPALIVELNLSDGARAEDLVRRSIVIARDRNSEDGYLLSFNLNRYLKEFNRGKDFPIATRRSVAILFADLLEVATFLEQERPRRCGISYYAPSIAPMIGELLPARLSKFYQNIATCLPYLPNEVRQSTAEKTGPAKGTVEDILKAARDAKDPDLKLYLFREAFLTLSNAKRFEQLASILDGFDGDEFQRLAPVAWDNWRVRAGFGATLASFEAGDKPTAARHLDRTPTRLRPFVREMLASDSSVAKDSSFSINNLNSMQRELDSIEIPARHSAKLFLALAGFYLSVIPTESERMFASAAGYINKADSENSEQVPEKDWAPMSDLVSVESRLLDVDEYNVFLSLKKVSSPVSRLRLSLGLLESSLKSLEAARAALAKQKARVKKKAPAS